MARALDLAVQAESIGEVPVGAVLILDGQIIGEGHNQPISLHDPTAHAEILALRDGARRIENYRLANTSLYSTLEPCVMCSGALYWSKIGKVVWGAADEKNGYSRVKPIVSPFHPKTVIATGVLKEECALLMKEFFKTKAWN